MWTTDRDRYRIVRVGRDPGGLLVFDVSVAAALLIDDEESSTAILDRMVQAGVAIVDELPIPTSKPPGRQKP